MVEEKETVRIEGSLNQNDRFHSDVAFSNQDLLAGSIIAHRIGDLFIDFNHDSPDHQWAKVMRALRIHGFNISFQ